MATTAFGEYHESDLQNMEMQRQIAKDFVRRILYASIGDARQMSPQLQNSIEQALDESDRAIDRTRDRRIADTGRIGAESRAGGQR